MRIRAVLTVPEAERFCDTYDSLKISRKPNSAQLQKFRIAIGQPDKSSSVITRLCLFYKLHGREKFIEFFAHAKGPDFSEQDYLRILEYAVSSGTSIDRAWIIFRCSRRKLEKLSLKRRVVLLRTAPRRFVLRRVYPNSGTPEPCASWSRAAILCSLVSMVARAHRIASAGARRSVFGIAVS